MFTGSLVLIISISSLSQYYFGMTYQLLLNADQKGYVQITLQWVTLLINTVCCIVLMKFGATIHIVRLVTTAIYVFRPLFLIYYVKKHYHIDKTILYDVDPIKQKWNGFAQHLSAVVVDNTDVAVLTIMSSLKNVSVYTVYYSVAFGITQVVMTTVNGLEAMWGNMLANEEWETLRSSFTFTEWLIHSIVTIIFTITALLITPFVLVYTRGVTDANYNQPFFGFLLVMAFAMQCFRVPYFRLIKAAGHYKQTQNGAFVTMVMNIVVSVVLVKKYGLIGVAIGTLVALAFHTCYFAWYLKNNILKRNIVHFFKHVIIDLFIGAASIVIINLYLGTATSYFAWILMALKVSISVVVIAVVINLIFYRKETLKLMYQLKNKVSR